MFHNYNKVSQNNDYLRRFEIYKVPLQNIFIILDVHWLMEKLSSNFSKCETCHQHAYSKKRVPGQDKSEHRFSRRRLGDKQKHDVLGVNLEPRKGGKVQQAGDGLQVYLD